MSAGQPPARRGRPGYDQETVLRRAVELFNRQGYDATSIGDLARELGFVGLMAGPLVRSSYRAGRLWAQATKAKGQAIPAHLPHLDTDTPARQEATEVLARHTAKMGS